MRSYFKLVCSALVASAIFACRISTDRSADVASAAASAQDVAGAYFAADSGHNLGKNWCYSAALVLDSTNHFGSVIKMCSDEGGEPVTESIKGTYALRRSTVKTEHGGRVSKLNVVLTQEGRGKRHTLVYENGALRFDEPWWLGAGLRALEIPDPTLRKVPALAAADSAAAPASSTAKILSATVPAQGKALAKSTTTK